MVFLKPENKDVHIDCKSPCYHLCSQMLPAWKKSHWNCPAKRMGIGNIVYNNTNGNASVLSRYFCLSVCSLRVLNLDFCYLWNVIHRNDSVVGCFLPLAFGVFKPSLEFKELQSEYCSTCTQPFIFCTMFFSLVIWERKAGGGGGLVGWGWGLHSSPESNRSRSSMQCPPKVYIILTSLQIRFFFVYPPWFHWLWHV